ncbi:MAG: hypothetical protein QOH24_1606 [Verrucomicrobiota bacterium]|jgi:hypothetical protein
MQFLLNLPPPISFVLVAAVTTTLAVAGLHLVRRKYPAEVLKENHEVAAIIFNAFGLLYGVVVAFVVFVTWSGYDDATKELQLEASDTVDIFYSAKAFPQPASSIIQQELMEYARIVYNDEINKMSAGQVSIYSGGPLRKLLALVNGMDEKSIPNRELYLESLRRLNNLAEHRRLRIFAGNNTIPPTVWLVLLVGGLITILYTYLFGTRNIKAQYLMISALTVTISWILLLIYILDHPFTGASRVSIQPMADVMQIMRDQYNEVHR